MRYLTHLSLVAQRAVAIVLLLIAAFLIWTALISPTWWLIRSQDSWRHRFEIILADQKGKAAAAHALGSQLEALRTARIWRALLSGDNEDAASEQIQREVAAIAQTAGARETRLQTLPKRQGQGLDAYGTRGTTAMTALQLKLFSSGIRTAPHFLRIERLIITAPQVQGPDQNPDLAVTFDVFGFAQRPSGANAVPSAPAGPQS